MSGNRKRVLVPSTMSSPGVALLQARDDIVTEIYSPLIGTAEFHALLPGAHGIALASTLFFAPEIAVATSLQAVGRIGVGFDSVEVPALSARGIPLLTAGIANSVSVAEEAVFLMLTLAKRGTELDRLVRQGRWHERFSYAPFDLWRKTVLVVGFGRIGTRAAARCAAFEMRVLVADPYVDAATVAAGGFTAVALDAALPEADFVTIHCPRNSETVGLFGAERLARMKPGSYLVNTARGGIVDEGALYAALVEGRLAGAGLDVFAEEPTATDNPLLTLDNVVAAPHMAGVTHEAMDRMGIATAENILSVLDGKPIRENVVNPEVL